MKRNSVIIRSLAILVAIFMFVGYANAGRYSRKQAKITIQQTSYIIDEAYEIANYYSYWQTNKLSRAMYYNDYAQDMYFHHSYRTAIRYSLFAREYALDVIDNCDDYWEYFYYTYYGWSMRYGYNYNFGYINGYRDGYYDAYYARYCYRHQHDYRRDPHRNMHSDWYNDQRYADVSSGRYFSNNNGLRNNSNTAIGRGDTGRNGSIAGSNSSTTITRPGYTGEPTNDFNNDGANKNIERGNYFSSAEMALLKDVPNKTIMENDYKAKNPTVSFNDENLRNNSTVIRRNKESAKSFSSNSTNAASLQRNAITKPTTIILNDGTKFSGKQSELPNIERHINSNNSTKKQSPKMTIKNFDNNDVSNSKNMERKENNIERGNNFNNKQNFERNKYQNTITPKPKNNSKNSNKESKNIQRNFNRSTNNSSSQRNTSLTPRKTTTRTTTATSTRQTKSSYSSRINSKSKENNSNQHKPLNIKRSR